MQSKKPYMHGTKLYQNYYSDILLLIEYKMKHSQWVIWFLLFYLCHKTMSCRNIFVSQILLITSIYVDICLFSNRMSIFQNH